MLVNKKRVDLQAISCKTRKNSDCTNDSSKSKEFKANDKIAMHKQWYFEKKPFIVLVFFK